MSNNTKLSLLRAIQRTTNRDLVRLLEVIADEIDADAIEVDTLLPKDGSAVGATSSAQQFANGTKQDTIDEYTSNTGVTVEGILFKDSELYDPTTTGITAFAGGGQASATVLTTRINNVTVCATAGDSIKMPPALAGLVRIIKNNGAAALDLFPATGQTLNGLAANTAIRIPPGTMKIFVGVSATNYQSGSIISVATGSAAIPGFSFDASPDMGFYRESATQLGVSVAGVPVTIFTTTGLLANVIGEITAGVGVTIDGVLLKDAQVNTDVINEATAAAGVTVDGVLLKDAQVTTSTILEASAGAGVTVDGALVKDGGVSANSTFASFYPLGAQQALSGAGAINITSYYTRFTSTGTGDALTLANASQPGQMKKVHYVAEGAGGDTGVITLTGYTSITLNAIGDYVILQWNGAAWFVLENIGATVV